MKSKWYLSALLIVLLSSSACTADPIPSSLEASQIEMLQQKYKSIIMGIFYSIWVPLPSRMNKGIIMKSFLMRPKHRFAIM